jgi:hypothetical protein
MGLEARLLSGHCSSGWSLMAVADPDRQIGSKAQSQSQRESGPGRAIAARIIAVTKRQADDARTADVGIAGRSASDEAQAGAMRSGAPDAKPRHPWHGGPMF